MSSRVETVRVRLAAGKTPPTEFRLFVAGANKTSHGTFVFDDIAAQSVMAAYAEHAVDLAIDVEHGMLDGASPDPTARDARGWFRLELRDDGSLWAVNVRWTDDGAARLTERRQRYISPAFTVDGDGRITSVINAAITSTPATHGAPALVAASSRTLSGDQTAMPTLADALAALEANDAAAAKKIIEALIAAEADDSQAEGDAPPAPKKKGQPEAPADGAEAATTRLLSITHTSTLVEALSQVERLARELSTFEARERVRLCRSLVIDAGRSPASVWADPLTAATKPIAKAHLARMSLADLERHVDEEVRAANGGKALTRPRVGHDAPKPPTNAGRDADGGQVVQLARGGEITISREEIASCAEKKIDLQRYAETRAAMRARRQGGA